MPAAPTARSRSPHSPASVAPLLSVRGVSKTFGATRALIDVDFDVGDDEVHALVGENGAGKSTLIKILSGIYSADTGQIALSGRAFVPTSPAEAQAAGIVLIPQELRIAPAMTVAENVLLGHWPTVGRLGPLAPISERRMRRRAEELLDALGVGIDVQRVAGDLSFAERQLLVIARALSHRARCLILDEPTASLESREVERLFGIVDKLRSDGTAIVYISHRLDEIGRIADRATVLRDGRVVTRYPSGGFTVDDLIKDMTGRSLEALNRPHLDTPGETVLEAALKTPGGDDQTLRLTSYRVTGLAGLLGSGASEIMLALYGASGPQAITTGQTNPRETSTDQASTDQTTGDQTAGDHTTGIGTALRVSSPRQAIDHGMGYVPSERQLGIVASLSVWENIALPHLALLRGRQRLSWSAIRDLAADLATRLDIRPNDPNRPAGSLSGGNQQKILFARWLVGRMSMLLLDEPTHGIDIGAKATIDGLIRDFAEQGGAVLMASSEFHELLRLSDEVLTMRHGRITRRLTRDDPAYGEGVVRQELGG